jgi:SAM-dependent methyltransferase
MSKTNYFDAGEVIAGAAKSNQTVAEYIETICHTPGLGSRVVDNLKQFGALNPATRRIIEIGTGAGLYAAPILRGRDDLTYESYELDPEWADWLARNFKIVSRPAPGDRLGSSEFGSADLVHANGVFVYTPFLVTIKYFAEIFRVVRNGGYAVFDVFSEQCFDGERIRTWLNSGYVYPCILPQDYVKRLFIANGFEPAGEFFANVPNEQLHPVAWNDLRTHYFVFRKRP